MFVRNAEFVPALFLLLLFLMCRKIPRIRNPNSLFALLCLFVCLWRIVGTLAKRTLAPIPWGLLRATASLQGCFCCFCLHRERNGKSRFEIPRCFTASSAQNSRNAFKGVVFRDKERVCVPITSGYPGYQRSFSRVGLDAFVGRRPTDLPPFFSAAE